MKRFAALAACVMLLAGCYDQSEKAADVGFGGDISVWHDNARGVTCYVFSGYQKGGLSCIPDSQLATSRSSEVPQ